MTKQINLIYEPGTLSAEAGSVTVYYLETTGEVRVLRNEDKCLLKTYIVGEFKLFDFIGIVNKMREIFDR